jgi:hypothetical protein
LIEVVVFGLGLMGDNLQVAGCSDDYATRIWRPDTEASRWLEREPGKAGVEWAGMIR